MTPWTQLVLLTGLVYVAFKGLAFRSSPGYLLLWPGMDPRPFDARRPGRGLGLAAWGLAKMAVGAGLLSFRAGVEVIDVLRVFLGIGLLLHFGLCDVLCGLWRQGGVPVERLFVNPAASRTLAEFWGRRWNLAFHAVVKTRVFRPVARRRGAAWGVAVSFLFSGLLHDLLLSVPAGGGWGLPMLYFVLQGAGVLGRIEGRLRTLLWVLLPAPLLFHPWFIRALILPLC